MVEDEEPGTPAEFVTVRAYRDLSEAAVARGVLEQAGIPCELQDVNTVTANWAWSNAIGGVKLQVPRSLVDRAEAVLCQPIPADFVTDGSEVFVQPACVRCGSLHVMTYDLDRKIKADLTGVGGLPLVVGLPALLMVEKAVWKCETCGCKWTQRDAEDSGEGRADRE